MNHVTPYICNASFIVIKNTKRFITRLCSSSKCLLSRSADCPQLHCSFSLLSSSVSSSRQLFSAVVNPLCTTVQQKMEDIWQIKLQRIKQLKSFPQGCVENKSGDKKLWKCWVLSIAGWTETTADENRCFSVCAAIACSHLSHIHLTGDNMLLPPSGWKKSSW